MPLTRAFEVVPCCPHCGQPFPSTSWLMSHFCSGAFSGSSQGSTSKCSTHSFPELTSSCLCFMIPHCVLYKAYASTVPANLLFPEQIWNYLHLCLWSCGPFCLENLHPGGIRPTFQGLAEVPILVKTASCSGTCSHFPWHTE